MTYSTDISLLLNGVYWVIFRFEDGSVKLIRTSLNVEYIDNNVKPGHLFDSLSNRYINLDRLSSSSIEIYSDRPDLSEVDEFANKYII